MQFSIARDILIEPLQMVANIVENSKAHPIYNHVLLQIKDGTLFLTTTDSEIQIQTKLPLAYHDENISTTLPAKKLLSLCKSFPDSAIIDFNVETDRTILRVKNSRFTLAALAADQFPQVPEVAEINEIEISAKELLFLIQNSYFAMAQQDVRFTLNGLFFEIKQTKLTCVGTNAHRLSLALIDDKQFNLGKTFDFIVPRKAVMQLLHMLHKPEQVVKIVFGEEHIEFCYENTHFVSKLIDGRFPDYNVVIPRDFLHEIVIDRDVFKQILARSAIIITEKYQGVALEFSDNLMKVIAYNADHEEAEEQIIIDYHGEELSFGFNVSYLIDILNTVKSKQIKLSIAGAESGLIIKGLDEECAVFMVMPMSL